MGRYGTHRIEMDEETQKRYDEEAVMANKAWREHCRINDFISFLRGLVRKELKQVAKKYGDILSDYENEEEVSEAQKRGECRKINRRTLHYIFTVKNSNMEETLSSILKPLEDESHSKWDEFDKHRNTAYSIWYTFLDEYNRQEKEKAKAKREQKRLEQKLAREREKRAEKENRERLENAYKDLTAKILSPVTNEEFNRIVKDMGEVFALAKNYTIKVERKAD